MPRKGQYLERGFFKSRLVVETASFRKDCIPWSETEALLHSNIRLRLDDAQDPLALGAIGPDHFRESFENLKIVHARLPMAKTIEGDFHILQRHARPLPGHLGFNERFGKRDRLNEFMDLCRAGKAHPAEEGIMDLEELGAAYRSIMEEHNAEPNQGARCRGESPDQLWSRHVIPAHPLETLPAHLGYIFASVKREARVRETGITIKDKEIDPYQPQVYFGHPRLGELIGERVEVRYNPHRPELIWVKYKGERFPVDRQLIPAWGATKEQLQKASRDRWNHMAPSVVVAGKLRHQAGATIVREDRFPEEQLAHGRMIQEAEIEVAKARSQESREIEALRREAQATGAGVVADLNTPLGRQAQRFANKAARIRMNESGGVR